MQLLECLHAEPLGVELRFEGFDERYKLGVVPLITGVGRAAIRFHAGLLEVKMHLGIGLEKNNQPMGEVDFTFGGTGVHQQGFQLVDPVDQKPVLLVNGRDAGGIIFVPNIHNIKLDKTGIE